MGGATSAASSASRRRRWNGGERQLTPPPQLQVDGLQVWPDGQPPQFGLQTHEQLFGSGSYVLPQLSDAVSQTQPHTPAPFWNL